jgi:hypothetical protein
VASDLKAGKAPAADAKALAVAARELRDLDTHLQLALMVRRPPNDKPARERAYSKLLWTLASNGSVPAARLLGKAWGIRDAIGKIEIGWEEDDGDTSGPAPSATTPPEAHPQ